MAYHGYYRLPVHFSVQLTRFGEHSHTVPRDFEPEMAQTGFASEGAHSDDFYQPRTGKSFDVLSITFCFERRIRFQPCYFECAKPPGHVWFTTGQIKRDLIISAHTNRSPECTLKRVVTQSPCRRARQSQIGFIWRIVWEVARPRHDSLP